MGASCRAADYLLLADSSSDEDDNDVAISKMTRRDVAVASCRRPVPDADAFETLVRNSQQAVIDLLSP